ncbi:MAG TPA: glycosyltransferase family 39 protein [Dehalococcoidia bacterium]|nr:glycosyltransferase family 39 protein [Dehalococcoidia bacterium]
MTKTINDGIDSMQAPEQPRQGSSRQHLLLLGAILLLALALRLAWIAYAHPNPDDGRFDDTLFYDHAAQALAAGEGFPGFFDAQTAGWPPGYPLLLAGIYKTFGHDFLAPRLLNVFAGVATCLLVYLIGARVFDRRTGLIAAFLLAVFPSHVYRTTLLMTEVLTGAIVALLAYLLLTWVLKKGGPSRWQAVALGVLFGAFALTRGEALAFVPVALIAWKLVEPSWRRFAGGAALMVAASVLVIAPWTVRNAIAMDAFIPIASGLGHTFLAGHQDDPYDTYSVFPEAKITVQYSYLPYPEREMKVEREALRQGLDFAKSHPGYEVQLVFEKLYNMYRSDDDAMPWIGGGWIDASKAPWLEGSWVRSLDAVGAPVVTIPPDAERNWKHLANGYYFGVLLLAAAGVFAWFSIRDRAKLLLVLIVAAWTALHLAFIPGSRYHAPLLPLFALWAAVGIVFVWNVVSGAVRSMLRARQGFR